MAKQESSSAYAMDTQRIQHGRHNIGEADVTLCEPTKAEGEWESKRQNVYVCV